MADADPKPRKVPLGDPLTREQLEKMAEVSEDDLEDAKERWRQNSASAFKGLLDAERTDGSDA